MSRHPNVLLVIVDDMGVHQLGCYGSTFYETPHIDRLAREGVRFGCAYSASPICSPARAALYTGMHPARLHLTNYIPGTEPSNGRLLTPPWRPYLPVEIDTVGDLLKRAGYATGHFGKWHLAPDYKYEPGRPMDPESQGFDTVLFTRKPAEDADPESDPHNILRLADRAIEFMARPREGPFLCVVAHNALHRPELAPATLVEKFARKPGSEREANRPVIAAMAHLVDESVGRMVAHLEASGQTENTLVIFTCDHGAFGRSTERKPLRGAKADLYEAGIRVPLILRRPGSIAPGERAAPVFGTDVLPTLLDHCGLTGALTTCDGTSFHASLLDAAVPLPPHDELCWHFPHYHHLGLAPCGAIRVGPWKLIEWFERTIGLANDGPAIELFNLESDPSESNNLASAEPQRCAELHERLRAWRRRIGAQEMTVNPNFDPDHVEVAPPPPGDRGNPFRS